MKKTISGAYLAGLKKEMKAMGMQSALKDLAATHGASEEVIAHLRAVYPQCPDALIELLMLIDGTYHRKFGKRTVSCCILGSDIFEFPYYLLSADQILAGSTSQLATRSIRDIYGEQMDVCLPVTRDRKPGEGNRDDRISPDLPLGRWLHFANCMNNGGSSQLFIDFNPEGEGGVGQVVRFLHDPDSYQVIAHSFTSYLQNLIDDGYAFLSGIDDEDA